MSLQLDFVMCPQNRTSAVKAPITDATEIELRYYWLPGDIIFRKGDVDFSIEWGWVQILDFALALKNIVNSLENEQKQTFEFTESDAKLHFRHVGERVEITASYTQGMLVDDFESLKSAVRDFNRRVMEVIASEFPESQSNLFLTSIKL